MDLKEQKNKKRKEFKEIRSRVSPSLKNNIYKQVKDFLLTSQKDQISNKYYGLYWPLAEEINLLELKTLQNIQFALPACINQNEINYYPWKSNTLEKDFAGIPAPIREKALQPETLELLLVPAIAIDKRAFRLGYGKGYFDFLRSHSRWRRIPAYLVIPEACISNIPLPREEWDIPFDGWISERGTILV